MMNSRNGLLLLAAVVVLALAMAMFAPRLVGKKPVAKDRQDSRQAQVGITAKGVVESSEEVELTSQVKGTLQRMLVEEGSAVKKGQLLVEFDDAKVNAQLEQAKAALAAAEAHLKEVKAGYRSEDVTMAQSGRQRLLVVFQQAKDDYERQRRLYDKDATTLMELNRAQEKMRVAEAQLKEAEADLLKHRHGSRGEEIDQARATRDRALADVHFAEGVLKDYRVYAPIDGLVTARLKDRGEGADTGTPLLRLANPALYRIRAELEETDVGKVKEGQAVEVVTDAYRDKLFAGTVQRVLPGVKKKSQKSFDPMASFDINTQEIHIKLRDFNGLKNGMTVTVRFK